MNAEKAFVARLAGDAVHAYYLADESKRINLPRTWAPGVAVLCKVWPQGNGTMRITWEVNGCKTKPAEVEATLRNNGKPK